MPNREWIVQGWYEGRWEDETAEESRAEGQTRLKEYRENVPGTLYRLISRKVEA